MISLFKSATLIVDVSHLVADLLAFSVLWFALTAGDKPTGWNLFIHCLPMFALLLILCLNVT